MALKLDINGPCADCNLCTRFKIHGWRKACDKCKCSVDKHDIFDDSTLPILDEMKLDKQPIMADYKEALALAAKVNKPWLPVGLKNKEEIEEFISYKFYPDSVNKRKKSLRLQIPVQDRCVEKFNDLSTVSEREEAEKFLLSRNNQDIGLGNVVRVTEDTARCAHCYSAIKSASLAVTIEQNPEQFWHPDCFKCSSCEELLVDYIYSYYNHKLYCIRHYAENIWPRCTKCDELIFATEIIRTGDNEYHVNHFVCFFCDTSLAEQKTFLQHKGFDTCVECYNEQLSNKCIKCSKLISYYSKDLSYHNNHWHYECFLCSICNTNLVTVKFIYTSDTLYCVKCHNENMLPKCSICKSTVVSGSKLVTYDEKWNHFHCFLCNECKKPIGNDSFFNIAKQVICSKCFDLEYANKCRKCDKVPLEISILNGHVKVLRQLLSGVFGGESIIDRIFKIEASLDGVHRVIDHCRQVDNLSQSFDSIEVESGEIVRNIQCKLRELDPLIERRKGVCESIHILHTELDQLLKDISVDRMNQLSNEVEKMSITMDNLIEILSINDQQTERTEESVDRLDEIRDRFLELRDTDCYHSMIENLESMSRETEGLVIRYKELLEELCRDYTIGDALPDRVSVSVPLIDRTFELYAAMKKEADEMIRAFDPSNIRSSSSKESEDESSQEGVIDIHSMILIFKQYLAAQTVSLRSVVTRTARLEQLDECARLILQDDSQLFMSIELNHKKLIACRSSLKHKIADMEDAEEQDESDKIDQISKEIQDIRASLHEHLQASRDILTDGETSKVMQRKPELQLKNQSILFTSGIGDSNEAVFPVFLWDNIFFNIPRESQSSSSSLGGFLSTQDSSSDYFITEFLSFPVCMKRLSFSYDNYSSVVRNLSTYSCRAATISDTLVTLMPVTLAFLSRSEGSVLYLMLPTFAPQQKLPSAVTDTIPALIDFCRSIIDHIVSLWHLGFTFTDQDLSYGGLLLLSIDQPGRTYLPLPLCSIINREDISLSSRSSSSLQICFSRLAPLMQQCLSEERADLANVSHDLVSDLIDSVFRCTTIDQAKFLCTELDSFLETVLISQQSPNDTATLDNYTATATEKQDTSVNNSDNDSSVSSSLNDNDSSIEQIEQPEEVEPPVSPTKGDESVVIEEVLETVSNVE